MARQSLRRGLVPGLGLILLSLSACTPGASSQASISSRPVVDGWIPPTEVSHPPFREETFRPNWLETRGGSYVYMEVLGDYRRTGSYIRPLIAEAQQQGLRIAPNASPFCLFYDDPGSGKPVQELRARVGIELERPQESRQPLFVDSLPGGTAVHACVSGPYPGAQRAYPLLFRYMGRMNWERNGPIQEIYHVSPGPDVPEGRLICEILIPVRSAPR